MVKKIGKVKKMKNHGKWFISRNGNRCRYIYEGNKKVGVQWRSTKKTIIQGRMQKNSGFTFFHNTRRTTYNEKKSQWNKAKRGYRKARNRKKYFRGYNQGMQHDSNFNDGLGDSIYGDNYGTYQNGR